MLSKLSNGTDQREGVNLLINKPGLSSTKVLRPNKRQYRRSDSGETLGKSHTRASTKVGNSRNCLLVLFGRSVLLGYQAFENTTLLVLTEGGEKSTTATYAPA